MFATKVDGIKPITLAVMGSVAILAAACQGVPITATGDARATGVRTGGLAAGKLESLPSGNVFIRVQSFVQDPGNTFGHKSHQSQSGFIFVADGVERQTYVDGETVEAQAGQAYFQRSAGHSHANPGTSVNHWFFLAVWPSATRGAAQVNPLARVAYETQDLPPVAIPPGSLTQTLSMATLAPGGRSAAHKHGGVEVLFVLTGSVTVHLAGQAPVTVGPGQGAWHAPGTVVQETNTGSGPASYLLYLVTAEGQPFETAVDRAL